MQTFSKVNAYYTMFDQLQPFKAIFKDVDVYGSKKRAIIPNSYTFENSFMTLRLYGFTAIYSFTA